MKHVMIDLETLGTESDAVILSIGAVEFRIETGETDREFHELVNIQSCIDHGLTFTGDTIYWWLQQSQEARDGVAPKKKPGTPGGTGLHIAHALHNLRVFLDGMEEDYCVWGNSARFDLGILQNAYRKVVCTNVPWNFRNERDVRTYYSLIPELAKSYKFEGIRHSPVDDCKHQIMVCSAIHKKITNGLVLDMMDQASMLTSGTIPSRVFTIPTTGMTPYEAEKAIVELMSKYKNEVDFNHITGELKIDDTHTPYSKDYWMPVKPEKIIPDTKPEDREPYRP